MSFMWIPIVWSMLAGACLGGGLTYFLTRIKRPGQRAGQIEQNKAELHQSEQRMDQAAAVAKLGTWEWDMARDMFTITYGGRALYGFAPAEPIDCSRLLNALHTGDRDAVRDALNLAREQGGSFECDCRVVAPGGGERWIATRAQVDVDAAGKAVFMRGVSFDVTTRKEAEDRFRMVVEAAANGMIMLNPGGRITFVNPSAEAIFGYPRQELIGQSIEMLLPERFRARHLADRVGFFASPSARKMEGREVVGRCKDGSEVPLEVSLAPIHIVEELAVLATIVDVSEHRKRDALLKHERAFLRQVIDNTPSMIFAKDRLGRYTLANRAVADIYGTTVDALMGKTDADFNRNAEQVQSFRRTELEVMDTLQERFIAEEHMIDAAGRDHWLQAVMRPILSEDGKASQIVGSATDITARKNAELELGRQRNELAHLSRVTMLSELSGSLAHELNQPLTAILSNAQAALRFLAAGNPNLDELREILRDIVDDDRRAGEVIQGLRLLLKKGEMRRESLDMNEVVRDVMKLVRSDLLNTGVGMITELESALPSVTGDRVQLQQVLLNLVVNGCDAMAGAETSDRRLVVSTGLDDSQCVRVRVADHGPGIPAEHLERVFDPFFTTKTHGLGLGLAVCRNIIAAHGGRLWAANEAGRGTSFSFTVPVNAGCTA